MATTKRTKWSEILADYSERINEICGILSDDSRTMRIKRYKGSFALSMDDGQIITQQIDEADLKSMISALWLMAGETENGRNIASFFVLKLFNDFHLA